MNDHLRPYFSRIMWDDSRLCLTAKTWDRDGKSNTLLMQSERKRLSSVRRRAAVGGLILSTQYITHAF